MSLISFAFPLKSLSLACLAILTLSACDDEQSTTPEDVLRLEEGLRIVHQDSTSAFLGLWSDNTPENMFVVGGSTDLDGGLILRRAADKTFKPESIPLGPLLWWIDGIDTDHLWAVGDGGRIIRRRNGAWLDESPNLDEKMVLWGVLAISPTNIWAVGGSVRRNGPKAVVLRSNGDGVWRRIESNVFPEDLNFYKAWAADDGTVFIVGEGGVTCFFDGRTFHRVDTGISDLLFTVDGSATGPILAVGGASEGQVFKFVGQDWVRESIPVGPGLNGVTVRNDGSSLAVGNRGLVLYRSPQGKWTRVALEERAAIGVRTLHAVNAYDRVWSVGGELSDMTRGIIITER